MLGKKSLRIRMRDVQTSDIEPITPQIEVCTCLHWPENLVKNEIFTQSHAWFGWYDGPARLAPMPAHLLLLRRFDTFGHCLQELGDVGKHEARCFLKPGTVIEAMERKKGCIGHGLCTL